LAKNSSYGFTLSGFVLELCSGLLRSAEGPLVCLAKANALDSGMGKNNPSNPKKRRIITQKVLDFSEKC
jgi:hypothetical protein